MSKQQSKRATPCIRKLIPLFGVISALMAQGAIAGADPDQSAVRLPAGDGWQLLGSQLNMAPEKAIATVSAAPTSGAFVPASAALKPLSASTEVKAVVLSGASNGDPTGMLSVSITPQDMNLRNALDGWLQTQGWQLAWKIDDDLPVEFNASFGGDFDSVLTQVMQATNHMRTPARICEHTNNVIRVIARAANCQD